MQHDKIIIQKAQTVIKYVGSHVILLSFFTPSSVTHTVTTLLGIWWTFYHVSNFFFFFSPAFFYIYGKHVFTRASLQVSASPNTAAVAGSSPWYLHLLISLENNTGLHACGLTESRMVDSTHLRDRRYSTISRINTRPPIFWAVDDLYR